MRFSLPGRDKVSLSIGTSDIRLLWVEGRRVKKWGSASLQPGLVKDGLILDPKVVGREIRALFDAVKAPTNKVIVGLSGLPFSYRMVNLPKLKGDLEEEAIVRSAKKEIPVPLDELYLSWRQVPSRNGGKDFFVLGVTRSAADTVMLTMAEAGIKGEVLDLRELALARAANQREAFVVSLEGDSYDVVLIADGMPAVMQTVTPRQKGATMQDNISRLTDQLSRTVQFHNSSHPEHTLGPETPVLLAGELCNDESVAEMVQANIGFPVQSLAPPLAVPPNLPLAEYATNVGLVLKGMMPARTKTGGVGFYDINLDLLVSLRRNIPVRRVSGYVVIGTLIALAAGLLIPSVRAWQAVGDETEFLQTELVQSMRDLSQVRSVGTEVAATESSIADVLEAAAALKLEHDTILSAGAGFGSILSTIRSVLPEQASLSSLTINAEEITIRGLVGDATSAIRYADALDRTGRFEGVRIAELRPATQPGAVGKTSFVAVALR
jgi:Tfp pilus assembly PilM family ATPase/Tfp pilus assembly protein PilN